MSSEMNDSPTREDSLSKRQLILLSAARVATKFSILMETARSAVGFQLSASDREAKLLWEMQRNHG